MRVCVCVRAHACVRGCAYVCVPVQLCMHVGASICTRTWESIGQAKY